MVGVVNNSDTPISLLEMTISTTTSSKIPPKHGLIMKPPNNLEEELISPVLNNAIHIPNVALSAPLGPLFNNIQTSAFLGTIYSSNNLSGPIIAWVQLNNDIIKNISAIGSVSGVNDYCLLSLSFTLKFKKNDRLSFGIRSDASTSIPNAVCMGKNSSADIYTPSFTITAIKC